MQLNPHYAELNESYLFSTIAHKVADYQKAHPDADIIRLGIGDVTLPLAASVTRAMHDAVEEQAHKETFHGYIPSEQGYGFLREAIRDYYADHGVTLDLSEIFISDGAKSDLGNLLDLFSQDNTVLVPDPVYPVYVDDNVMAGRKILYLPANAENNFLPMPDAAPHADIVYLCSPNNPTGATYTVEQLKAWVRWAKQNDALILFDAAYECFVTEPGLARSIYEVEGAKEVAVEVCSFSKIAGFTGTRCGYTVVPQDIRQGELSLNKMWLRRQTTKFNGVAYVVQRGAAAVFTPEGMREIRENLNYYRKNAAVIAQALDEMGIWYCGGKNSPYIWLRCPNQMDSWAFFDWLLENANVVGTPGEGFGACGQGYFRLTAFGDADRTKEAAQRIKSALAKL
ncbi:LL-diaminopimelate aminotransferase [uncultured Gemmiger sp.]|uniref:LL-diaminopimelate aminotransferase n=1 Tax=uncultured Gemmiger sp. TaxID=1623490 RepID=UPI0025E56D92|nr:LL-diaminopimelate aminotransferase [uncultured Gemmiger sp.]